MGKGSSGRRLRGGGCSAGGSKRPRRVAEEEAEAEAEAEAGEDYCFVCKDGGELRVCDFRSCHKAYHPGCVGKDSDFLSSDEEFICEWHTCFICEGRTRYYCFCCPHHTFCQGCVKQAEFVPVIRKTKGFCWNCLRMAIMIERNVDVDSDGERVDFSDRETYEFLFKEYWEIVKDKEGLTLHNLEEAYVFLKKGLNHKQDSDLEILPDEEHKSDDDFSGRSDDGDDEPSSLPNLNGPSKKVKVFLKKGKSKKNAYVGWGSKELIGFLLSIGKDTSKSLDQIGAAEVVKEYIRQKGLLQKDKKKHVICDDKLHSLFRKSKLMYNRIYSLLERHIAENMTSEDETLSSSEDNNDSVMKKKARTVSYECSTPKRTSEINKRCFASLVRDNIKLIYLKRSLVMDLLKEPDTFGNKVIGCFVRVKNDPKDFSYQMPKRLYQLGQVTGIRKSSEEYKIRDIYTDVLLCTSNISDVKISMLSDEDFEEEECEDLRLLAQKESFKRLTVGDLEEKARNIHRDIVSHWINKELRRLEKLIEMAHEKGWRNEMHEYMDKKKLLREPSERQRLLEEVPEVIPDTEYSKDTKFQVAAKDKSIQKNTVAFQGIDWEIALSLKSCSEEKPKATKADADGGTSGTHVQKQGTKATEANVAGDILCVQKQDTEATEANADGDTPAMHVQRQNTEATKANTAGDTPGKFVQKQGAEASDADMTTQVIILDDDEDDNLSEKGDQTAVADLDANGAGNTCPVRHETNNSRGQKPAKVKGLMSQRKCVWYYIDPQGDEQGPFTMEHLRHWWNDGHFPEDFKVWRTGQTSDSAILLRDALQVTR
ncbi:uncharacterized protein At5g08430-like isoform X2 [Phragmites australis]|uniref:uncharacterized protein At5g08430-like isoform X2 n=1 Tax=Phragmites australis TaxID=29695 RepID=UPI002D796055|nr:uncharacterized protein At5g08430-like isoform X2 [Phragmites australis]